jgi:hypothetical protein
MIIKEEHLIKITLRGAELLSNLQNISDSMSNLLKFPTLIIIERNPLLCEDATEMIELVNADRVSYFDEGPTTLKAWTGSIGSRRLSEARVPACLRGITIHPIHGLGHTLLYYMMAHLA